MRRLSVSAALLFTAVPAVAAPLPRDRVVPPAPMLYLTGRGTYTGSTLVSGATTLTLTGNVTIVGGGSGTLILNAATTTGTLTLTPTAPPPAAATGR